MSCDGRRFCIYGGYTDHRRCGSYVEMCGPLTTATLRGAHGWRGGQGILGSSGSTDLETNLKGVPAHFTRGLVRARDCNYVVL